MKRQSTKSGKGPRVDLCQRFKVQTVPDLLGPSAISFSLPSKQE